MKSSQAFSCANVELVSKVSDMSPMLGVDVMKYYLEAK
jgi:hypothetical protein